MTREPFISHGVSPTVAIPTPSSSGASWSAIFAGAVVACTASLTMAFAAAAIGLTMVSPWWALSASTTSIAVSGAVAIVLIQWISSALGGFVTGRLRSPWADLQADEVFFRDTVNGLLAWSVATLFVAALALGSATHIGRGAAQVAGGAASAAGQVAASAGDQNGYFVDRLLRPQVGATTPPAAGETDVRGELSRIFGNAGTGEIAQPDRAYLTQRVAERTGLSQAEAETRVNETLTALQAAKARAQQIAEEARKNTRRAAILTFLSLLIGAFIACAASALGASYRDDT
jgi:hypothetical protein